MKYLWTILAVLTFSLSARATDFYYGQNSAGSNNGTNCANAYAYNDGTNGWNTAGKDVAGNTLHACGTFTGGAGVQWMSLSGGGSSGNPLTIKFETGAVMTAPYHSGNGAIALNSHTWITVDGGTNGTIQNTLNGSSGGTCPGGSCTTQQDSRGVTLCNCNNSTVDANVEVKNLNILNMYVHTYLGNDPDTYNRVGAIEIAGAHVHIDHNKIWNATECLRFEVYGTMTVGPEIDHNDLGYCGWGLGVAGDTSVVTSMSVHDNHFHDYGNWQSDNGSTHINGIFAYNGSGGSVNTFYLYNNLFDGDMGFEAWTTWIHFGSDAGAPWSTGPGLIAWNNVAYSTLCLGNGIIQIEGGSANQILNNYLGQQNNCTNIATNNSGVALSIGNDVFSTTLLRVENNVMAGEQQPIKYGGSAHFTTQDYNAYGDIVLDGNEAFHWAGHSNSGTSTLAAWQSVCSCEAHSTATSPIANAFASFNQLTGVPSAGFIGTGAGVDLSSLATGALATLASATTAGGTTTAIVRTVPWTMGAYAPAGGVVVPTPVTILTQTLPGATSGIPWSAPPLSASGGTPPFQWSGINFPQGLSLTAAGAWNPWTPTATVVATTYPLGITVSDSGSPQQSKFATLPLVVSAAAPPQTSGGPTGYSTKCAIESKTCTTTPGNSVGYGANGTFIFKNASTNGTIGCDNSTFGKDPIPGVAKACYAKDGGVVVPPPVAQTLTFGPIICSATATVGVYNCAGVATIK